jgi:hypothetical protein
MRQTEYRVDFQRHGWTQPQFKLFQREHALDLFLGRLHGRNAAALGLSPIEWIKVSRREVGPWIEETA